MSGTDVTSELPILTRAPQSSAVQLLDTDVVGAALDELAVSLPDRPMFLDRVATLWSEIVSTSSRSALATLWGVLLIIVLVTWISQPERNVQTATGPARVSCGLDVYLYGYPDHTVASTCRAAEAVRFGLFIPALLGVIAGLIAVCAIVARKAIAQRGRERSLLGQVTQARWEALAIAIGLLALVVGLFALRPVPAAWISSGVLVTAHCGADTYIRGYPVHGVDTSCSQAFATQGHILEVCALLVLLGAFSAIRLAFSATVNRRRLIRLATAAALGVAAVVTLLPVTVVAKGLDQSGTAAPGSETISCGVDVWLAGYPQLPVQHLCRSVLATRAPIGLAAGGASVGLAAWGLLCSPKRPTKQTRRRRGGAHQEEEAWL